MNAEARKSRQASQNATAPQRHLGAMLARALEDLEKSQQQTAWTLAVRWARRMVGMNAPRQPRRDSGVVLQPVVGNSGGTK